MTGLKRVGIPSQTAKGRIPGLPGGSGEAELRADFTGKGARRLHDARVNFHLLGFPVDLAKQVIDFGDRGGNVPDDQSIRANVREDVSAGRQEFFDACSPSWALARS